MTSEQIHHLTNVTNNMAQQSVANAGLKMNNLFAPDTNENSNNSNQNKIKQQLNNNQNSAVNDENKIATTQSVEEKFILNKQIWISPTESEYEALKQHVLKKIEAGNGEAIFSIGDSDGDSALTQDELNKSIETMFSLEKAINVSVILLREKNPSSTAKLHNHEMLVENPIAETTIDKNNQTHSTNISNKFVREYLIRRVFDCDDFIEVRVAVVGNVDSGKSTLLGVLTHGVLDDGRGHARTKLFRHKHEIESGRTSSVGNDILGFDPKGKIVNDLILNGTKNLDWETICKMSAKVLTFIDLAGHEKYLKTTVFGMTGHAPDFCMLMIGSNMGIVGMTKEHLGLALALNVPVFVVLTKIDLCPPNVFQETLKILQKILKSPGCRKLAYLVENHDDVVTCAMNFTSERLCPIFQVSNVTGLNIDLLKSFLNLLNTRMENQSSEPAEFQIDDIYSVPGVGTVVSGTCYKGKIQLNDTLLLGPDLIGQFRPVQIKGIHRKRMPVKECRSGQTASFALKKIKRSELRKGMVLINEKLNPIPSWSFEAEILVLHHPTTISPNYQAMVHCGSIRQTATIIEMSVEHMRTGDKATVKFTFIKNPEYLKVGSKMIFREGRTKAVGTITKINMNLLPPTSTSSANPTNK